MKSVFSGDMCVEENTSLNMADGETIPINSQVSLTYDPGNGIGDFIFKTEQLINPADAVSVTILGQTYELK